MARKLEFDKQVALNKAMLLFWEKGYEAASMEDLVQAMEINRFSIYNSFGDKKKLLLCALENYRVFVLHQLIAPLQSERAGVECLVDYFDNMVKQLSSRSGLLGCFIQKTGQSNIGSDPEIAKILRSMLEELRLALLNAVERAVYDGELKGTYSNAQIVGFILSQIQGLILLRRSGEDSMVIADQMQILKKTILTW